HVLSVDVRCTKKSLDVSLTFDMPFRGVIYSKGFFNDPQCRHVGPEGKPSRVVRFTMQADRCGTCLVKGGSSRHESSIESTIVVQNELEIQDASDTARKLRCSWDGHFDRTVSSSLHVDTLNVLQARYAGTSGDTFMDVQLGRGPFASPVTGVVKIGDTLTVVVYALGNDMDVHIKGCLAHDGNISHAVQLTDALGCVLKPKLLGPWQKTKKTGATGASAMAFAYLKAFKFPDKVEVHLECNVEMCSRQCSYICPQQTKRSKRQHDDNHTSSKLPSTKSGPPAHVTREIRVVSPEDLFALDDPGLVRTPKVGTVPTATGGVCMSVLGFVLFVSIILLLLFGSCVTTTMLFLRVRQLLPAAQLGCSLLSSAAIPSVTRDVVTTRSEKKVSRLKAIVSGL
ncbi:uncharacterized protein LOC135378388, partial [Ornithodoros turicata]|uniref:uncharacterized protein LOC135378388 n=1 Tax=Ornithodoros turicata TaxID=34597 RepID=UPI00313945A2